MSEGEEGTGEYSGTSLMEMIFPGEGTVVRKYFWSGERTVTVSGVGRGGGGDKL
jgi:hypothetical protein